MPFPFSFKPSVSSPFVIHFIHLINEQTTLIRLTQFISQVSTVQKEEVKVEDEEEEEEEGADPFLSPPPLFFPV